MIYILSWTIKKHQKHFSGNYIQSWRTFTDLQRNLRTFQGLSYNSKTFHTCVNPGNRMEFHQSGHQESIYPSSPKLPHTNQYSRLIFTRTTTTTTTTYLFNYASHTQQKLISRQGVGKQTLEKQKQYGIHYRNANVNFREYFTQNSQFYNISLWEVLENNYTFPSRRS